MRSNFFWANERKRNKKNLDYVFGFTVVRARLEWSSLSCQSHVLLERKLMAFHSLHAIDAVFIGNPKHFITIAPSTESLNHDPIKFDTCTVPTLFIRYLLRIISLRISNNTIAIIHLFNNEAVANFRNR